MTQAQHDRIRWRELSEPLRLPSSTDAYLSLVNTAILARGTLCPWKLMRTSPRTMRKGLLL